MRKSDLLLVAAIAAAPLAAEATGGASCPVRGSWTFPRKANLPSGAAAALGFPLAERGAPFQVSDSIGPGSRLPFDRFVLAHQTDCILTIRYEHGGIAHTFETAVLQYQGRRWVLVRRR
jgi:hypothetical protein